MLLGIERTLQWVNGPPKRGIKTLICVGER